MISPKLIMIAVALVLFGLAGAGRAASGPLSDPNPHRMKVSLAGVDLGSDDGAKVAFKRIRNAAKRLCSEEPGVRNVDLTYPYVTCLNATVDHAVGVLDAPKVTALAARRDHPKAILAANRR